MSDAKIKDFDLSAVVDHHVGAFYIPVDNIYFMGGFQALRDLISDSQRLVDGKWLALYLLCQGLALNVGHNEESNAIAFPDIKDAAHGRVIEGGAGLGLNLKSGS